MLQAQFVGGTIGRALAGGSKPWTANKDQPPKGSGPPLRLAAGLGVCAAALAAGGGNGLVRGVAGAGALLVGAWLGAAATTERARL